MSVAAVLMSFAALRPAVLPRAPPVVAMAAPVNEFCRPISVGALGRKATRNALSADEKECAALADRFDLSSLGGLDANVSLAVVDPRRMRVRAYGSFTASDIGVGSASLQASKVEFETFFVADDPLEQQGGGGPIDSGDDESYDEPIEDGQIDMGELVAQHFYLYVSDVESARNSEFDEPSVAPGTVVFDSDPDDNGLFPMPKAD